MRNIMKGLFITIALMTIMSVGAVEMFKPHGVIITSHMEVDLSEGNSTIPVLVESEYVITFDEMLKPLGSLWGGGCECSSTDNVVADNTVNDTKENWKRIIYGFA